MKEGKGTDCVEWRAAKKEKKTIGTVDCLIVV